MNRKAKQRTFSIGSHDRARRGSQPAERSAAAIFVWVLVLAFIPSAAASEWKFHVRFADETYSEPFTGRAYIFFSRFRPQPRTGPGWFNPELFVARDVTGWKPGELLTFSSDEPAKLLAFPGPPAEMRVEGYRAQAVVRFNPYERRVGTGSGNGYSEVITVADARGGDVPILDVEHIVPPRRFAESRWSKLLNVRSKLFSDFHGREVNMKAAVVLPASYYDRPERRYPTIYLIPGFGGTHFGGMRERPIREQNAAGVEFLRVFLDPSCPLGHHVFADSANNGPAGTALVQELIPELERRFRAVAEPTARFLTGHSSGGWSSLWLQISWPERFGGTWSTAPDPVDFRDFQQINLYRPGVHMYRDAQGQKRPLARRGSQVLIWYDDFAHMEWVLGHGGQLHSFEAVFSPRGENGKPLLLWNRRTGAVDPEVARSWKRYDIRLMLERNWPTLGPKLQGKLHVFMGGQDTFYLEGATKLLKASLEELGSDAVVEIHPGKNHGTLLTPQLRDRIRREMVEAFLREHPDWGT